MADKELSEELVDLFIDLVLGGTNSSTVSDAFSHWEDDWKEDLRDELIQEARTILTGRGLVAPSEGIKDTCNGSAQEVLAYILDEEFALRTRLDLIYSMVDCRLQICDEDLRDALIASLQSESDFECLASANALYVGLEDGPQIVADFIKDNPSNPKIELLADFIAGLQ